MADTVYVELVNEQTVTGGSTPSKYRVNLSPVDTIDDTYKTTLDTYNEEGEEVEPQMVVQNNKVISHIITITGLLIVVDDFDTSEGVTNLDPDPESAEGMQDPTSKYGRMRALMGYGGISDTQITININGMEFQGYIQRFSCMPTGGEVGFKDYILEILEGEPY